MDRYLRGQSQLVVFQSTMLFLCHIIKYNWATNRGGFLPDVFIIVYLEQKTVVIKLLGFEFYRLTFWITKLWWFKLFFCQNVSEWGRQSARDVELDIFCPSTHLVSGAALALVVSLFYLPVTVEIDVRQGDLSDRALGLFWPMLCLG